MTDLDAVARDPAGLHYLGLAPFLRASIAGQDLRPATERLLQGLSVDDHNPCLLMNLSLALQCLQQQPLGLAFQAEALTLARTYVLPAQVQPPGVRLLVLVTPGNLQSNTPLDCLLEGGDVELILHFVQDEDQPLVDLPAHDLLFVAVGESDASRRLLRTLQRVLRHWPRPVLNPPQRLCTTGRDRASRRLQGIPGLIVPVHHRVCRARLRELADGAIAPCRLARGLAWPLIVRPLGSQAGADLQRLQGPPDLQAYLAGVSAADFFLAPFVDYSDARGLFRKIRIALIDGVPYVGHLAISSHWMIHYLNAGMYEEASKRAEEARFMDDFPGFVQRHGAALAAISARMKLDYLVMDCAETRSGELLLFEIDHVGVVHAMDRQDLFPHKPAHIRKAQDAFRAMLHRRMAGLSRAA